MAFQTASHSRMPSPALSTLRTAWGYIRRGGILFWKWSVLHRNSHRTDDRRYAVVWSFNVDPESIRATLRAAFPDLRREELPGEEEDVRRFLHKRFPPPIHTCAWNHTQVQDSEGHTNADAKPQLEKKILQATCEETWTHIPVLVRQSLAAANALNLEKKLQSILKENYHCSAGLSNMTRSEAGVNKTFRLWRLGFAATVSTWERIVINIYFLLLMFMACYPDVAAGFLGERSYNQRSIGSRTFTLIQLFFLWTFPYHSFWLLYNWSLERLLGALVGNCVYALMAILPSVRASYKQTWLRITVLVLSTCWQVTVQFSSPVRDCMVRLLTRRQMSILRKHSKIGDGIDWVEVDNKIQTELTSHMWFAEQRASLKSGHVAWQDVPLRVRVERYIHFTSTYKLGRCSDQLIGLLKDDLENIINTLEDYSLNGHGSIDGRGGYFEPRMAKFLLVFIDLIIFAYVCYSFWTQPFTFNTVVAYSSVVTIKQTILAVKRYQTVKSARRLFTNMVSVNVLGMLLVSTPVIVDRDVLADTEMFVALTMTMVLATLLLAEPIAPILLSLMERLGAGLSRLKDKIKMKYRNCQSVRATAAARPAHSTTAA